MRTVSHDRVSSSGGVCPPCGQPGRGLDESADDRYKQCMTNWRGSGDPGSVAAQRLHVRPWRDPRLLIGVLLVLGATILGARLAAASDDTTEYWAVSGAVTPGDAVTKDELVATKVHLSSGAAGNYLRTDEEFDAPLEELVWAHEIAKGSLLDRTALEPQSRGGRSQLPLSVTQGAAPADLERGDLVDVWVGPGPGDEASGKSVRVLESVRVAQSGEDAAALGGSLAQTVLVDVDTARLRGPVISTVSAGHVTLIRVS